MSDVQQKLITTNHAEQTEELGERIGARLKGKECIELQSDLGGGKTTFVRGLARGADSSDAVSSPTFTVAKHYIGKTVQLYHYDFYRLDEPGLVAEELAESLEDDRGVSVVEWARQVQNVLPKKRLVVRFDRLKDDPEARAITLNYPKDLAYLVEGLS